MFGGGGGGGSMAPTSRVSGLQMRPGNRVQRQPVGADLLRAHAVKAAEAQVAMAARRGRPAACPICGGNRSAWSRDDLTAPTNCVPGLRKRPGHKVQ
eukprot:jgi/Tetstr1/422263/TSEL_013108.t1